ncbi:hypothetical protein ACFVOR_35065 [Streptomyces sp. NPDC057837]|uniref:hypothetical protein n=1 Tax=Streptomyces sp. NPDC057837 TaxID=3346260 RepID=UPI0036CFCDD3
MRSEANQSAAATQKAFFCATNRAASSTALPGEMSDLRAENRVDPCLDRQHGSSGGLRHGAAFQMQGLDGDSVEGGGGGDVRGDAQFSALLSFVPLEVEEGAQGAVGCLGDDVEAVEGPALGQICGHPVARLPQLEDRGVVNVDHVASCGSPCSDRLQSGCIACGQSGESRSGGAGGSGGAVGVVVGKDLLNVGHREPAPGRDGVTGGVARLVQAVEDAGELSLGLPLELLQP